MITALPKDYLNFRNVHLRTSFVMRVRRFRQRQEARPVADPAIEFLGIVRR
jgi:hypothetical protein